MASGKRSVLRCHLSRVKPVNHAIPEGLFAAAVEVFYRRALLLDPSVLGQVENAFTVKPSQLDHMVDPNAKDILTECFGGLNHPKAI